MLLQLCCRNVPSALDGARESIRWYISDVVRYLELWYTSVRDHDIWKLSIPRIIKPTSPGFCEKWSAYTSATGLSTCTVSLLYYITLVIFLVIKRVVKVVFQLVLDSHTVLGPKPANVWVWPLPQHAITSIARQYRLLVQLSLLSLRGR